MLGTEGHSAAPGRCIFQHFPLIHCYKIQMLAEMEQAGPGKAEHCFQLGLRKASACNRLQGCGVGQLLHPHGPVRGLHRSQTARAVPGASKDGAGRVSAFPKPCQGVCMTLRMQRGCGWSRCSGAGGLSGAQNPTASPPPFSEKNPAPSTKAPSITAHQPRRARRGVASARQGRDRALPEVFLQGLLAKGTELVAGFKMKGKLRHRGWKHRRAPCPSCGAAQRCKEGEDPWLTPLHQIRNKTAKGGRVRGDCSGKAPQPLLGSLESGGAAALCGVRDEGPGAAGAL